MTVEQMMVKLKDLFINEVKVESVNNIDNFNAWYEKASNTRYIRNRYVHGNWDFLRGEKPIIVSTPPWMKDRLGEDANESMTIGDLKQLLMR